MTTTPEAPRCRRCGEPVILNRQHYDTFEGMHYVCFHFEFEHRSVDVDTDCGLRGCPAGELSVSAPSGATSMNPSPRDARRQFKHARAEFARLDHSDPAFRAAHQRVLAAERTLAAARGEQYAEVIDLGVRWNAGAPLPHLVAGGLRAAVICLPALHEPTWDGTWTTTVSPSDTEEEDLIRIDISGYASVRIGSPNDEALHGHPLHGRGLVPYEAHEVHNSAWLEEHIRINSVHSAHRDEPWRSLRHILLAFHDEMVEVLCREITARVVRGNLGNVASDALKDVIGG